MGRPAPAPGSRAARSASPMADGGTVSNILNIVAASFAARRWTHRAIERPRAIEVTHDGAEIPWKSYAQAKDGDRVFVYYSLCPENAPPARRADVARYLTQASFGLVVGGFEMNWDDGEVRLKTSVDLHGEPLTGPLLQGVLLANHHAMADHLPTLLQVIRGESTPEAAYEAATAE